MNKIVMLAGDGSLTNIVYNYLSKYFSFEAVIIEEKTPVVQLLKKRIKNLGLRKVIGQVLFIGIIVRLLDYKCAQRKSDIKKQYGLDEGPLDYPKIIRVSSINSSETVAKLKKLEPTIVVVNGTRIISPDVLRCCSAKFINMHMGITPLYRGVHGGYWARVQGRLDKCGVTVHILDAGIDTGPVLEQGRITPDKADSFVTYPLLQLAVGLPLLKKSIEDLLAGKNSAVQSATDKSRLWSHPTLWEYLWYRIKLGIR